MKNKTGTVFIVSGPSGTGKGTIMERYCSKYPDDNIFLSVSATTRLPRPNDIEGVTYIFKTEEEFVDMINNDKFIEHAKFCDARYGTPREPIENALKNGVNVILEIEVQGGSQIMKLFDNAVGIFVLPPSFEELKRRLIGRNTDSMEKIEKRLERAKEEINEINHYDYILINDDVDEAVEVFRSILIGETQKVSRNKKTIKEVCEIC